MIPIQKREHRNLIKEWLYRFKYLKFSTFRKNIKQYGIAMVDGRNWHGGLTDRFKGMISFYNYCQSKGIPFKIYYIAPYKLLDYLSPNEYDWVIDQNALPNSIFHTRPFIAIGETGRRLLKLKTKKTILYYGNRDLSKYIKENPYNTAWGDSFKKLFKPSKLLEMSLQEIKKQVNGEYIAMVYRFQNLLGDFFEYDFKEIYEKDEKDKLIALSIETIHKIHKENPNKTILVTSDSATFLDIVKKLTFTYVIPGKVEHVDCIQTDSDHNQLKSFLDFFMIAAAKKVYSVVINEMYRSEFPEYAAKIENIPFERIVING